MDATSITNVNAEEKPTATVANAPRIDDGTGEADDTAATISPFFRLPRELRDEIYELAALSEETLYCNITLRADGPAQKTSHAGRDAHRTFAHSQFESEYSAAVERRIKSLVTGSDRNGLQLFVPGPSKNRKSGGLEVKAEEIWLEVSKGQQEDGKVRHSVHTLMLAIPLMSPDGMTTLEYISSATKMSQFVTFALKFPEKEELGPCLRFDCHWDGDKDANDRLLFLSDDGSISQQVLNVAKEMDWKGSVREYMLWQRYIVKYVRRGASPRF